MILFVCYSMPYQNGDVNMDVSFGKILVTFGNFFMFFRIFTQILTDLPILKSAFKKYFLV